MQLYWFIASSSTLHLVAMLGGYTLRPRDITSTRREKLAKQG